MISRIVNSISSSSLDDSDAILVFSGQSKILLDANDRARDITKLPNNLETKVSIDDITTGENGRLFREIFDEALTLGYAYSRSMEFSRVDGYALFFEGSGWATVIAKQSVVIIFLKDLTPRFEMEKALRESEILFRSFFEQIPDAVFIENEDDDILDANLAATKLLGYSREEFLTMKVSDLIGRDGRRRIIPRSIIKSELAKTEPFESVDLHKSGYEIPVEVRTGRLVGVKRNLVLSIVRDITERKKLTENLERQVADRMNALAVLYDIVAETSGSVELISILQRSLDLAVNSIHACVGTIHLLNGENQNFRLVVQHNLSENNTMQLDDYLTQYITKNFRTEKNLQIVQVNLLLERKKPINDIAEYIGIPIRSKGNVLGVISIFREFVQPLLKDDISLLNALSEQMGVAVEISQLRQQVETEAIGKERQRIAQDLHDSVTQSLYSLNFQVESWRRSPQCDQIKNFSKWMDVLEQTTHQILREMRMMLLELSPVNLSQLGIIGALRQRLQTIEKNLAIYTVIEANIKEDPPPEVEKELYYIALEAINNAIKHAYPSKISVMFESDNKTLFLQISDDGTGFDVDKGWNTGGMGLKSIQTRAQKIGCQLSVHSELGEGSQVRIYRKG